MLLLGLLVGSTHDPAPHWDERLIPTPARFASFCGISVVVRLLLLSVGIFSAPFSSNFFLWLGKPLSSGVLVEVMLLLFKLFLLTVLVLLFDVVEELLLLLLLR